MINTHMDTSYDQAPVLWLLSLLSKTVNLLAQVLSGPYGCHLGPVHVPKSGATYRNNKQIQSIDMVINYTCMLILCTRNGLTGK